MKSYRSLGFRMLSFRHAVAFNKANRGSFYCKQHYIECMENSEDIIDLVGVYVSMNGLPLSNPLKKAIRDKIGVLRHLCIDHVSEGFKMADIIRLCHPKPNDINREAIKNVIIHRNPIQELINMKQYEKAMQAMSIVDVFRYAHVLPMQKVKDRMMLTYAMDTVFAAQHIVEMATMIQNHSYKHQTINNFFKRIISYYEHEPDMQFNIILDDHIDEDFYYLANVIAWMLYARCGVNFGLVNHSVYQERKPELFPFTEEKRSHNTYNIHGPTIIVTESHVSLHSIYPVYVICLNEEENIIFEKNVCYIHGVNYRIFNLIKYLNSGKVL